MNKSLFTVIHVIIFIFNYFLSHSAERFFVNILNKYNYFFLTFNVTNFDFIAIYVTHNNHNYT